MTDSKLVFLTYGPELRSIVDHGKSHQKQVGLSVSSWGYPWSSSMFIGPAPRVAASGGRRSHAKTPSDEPARRRAQRAQRRRSEASAAGQHHEDGGRFPRF